MKVLVVDDDALVLMATTSMVEDLGHAFVAVKSAAAALQQLSSQQEFELLITDFAMPDMNGLELAIAARAVRPDIPIILATGYAYFTDKYNVIYELLQKPFTLEDLASAVEKVMF